MTRGYDGRIHSATSKARLTPAAWLAGADGRLTLRTAREQIASRRGWPNHSVNNPGTAFATLAQPQKEPRTLWVADMPITAHGCRKWPFD